MRNIDVLCFRRNTGIGASVKLATDEYLDETVDNLEQVREYAYGARLGIKLANLQMRLIREDQSSSTLDIMRLKSTLQPCIR